MQKFAYMCEKLGQARAVGKKSGAVEREKRKVLAMSKWRAVVGGTLPKKLRDGRFEKATETS